MGWVAVGPGSCVVHRAASTRGSRERTDRRTVPGILVFARRTGTAPKGDGAGHGTRWGRARIRQATAVRTGERLRASRSGHTQAAREFRPTALHPPAAVCGALGRRWLHSVPV